MPGPDGLPALAYKRLGDLAVDTLHGAIQCLSRPDAEAKLTEAFSNLEPADRHAFNASILCCLPKKPSGSDGEQGVYYKPGDTRPLNISNVDNRIIASAARLAWEPILEAWVSKMQRGFLKGREMLHNIIDVDWAAMKVSLVMPHGSLVLFDFRAAFPSVSHDFLIQSLTYLGLPQHAIHFIRSMYSQNTCTLRVQGQDFPGFSLLGGVRQGCPLSPLLFAVCVDLLLRMMEKQFPSDTICAFADDIAMIISDWWSQGQRLASLFGQFASISNLHLNINKTVCIPLWPKGVEDVGSNIATFIPTWASIAIDTKGTYLGFATGPGKGTSSWDKPLAKYIDRIHRWCAVGGGIQFAALSYNVFALSTLLFVSQLEQVPQHVLDSEAQHIHKMFPGPGTWILPNGSWFLSEHYGLARSLQPLRQTAQAAQLRVACLGCHFMCNKICPKHLRVRARDNIHSRWLSIKSCMNGTEHLDRINQWNQWYQGNHCKVLVDNMQALLRRDIDPWRLYKEIVAQPHEQWDGNSVKKIKRQFQNIAFKTIKRLQAPDPCERIRNKLERWRGVPYGLSGLPGHYARAIHRRLHLLAGLATPRIRAAVFRGLWNGWVTHRRLQKRKVSSNRCVFLCGGAAEDSIEHYCRCPVVLKVASQIFKIHFQAEDALNAWLLNCAWLDAPEHLLSMGMLIYGTYMAFNTCRYRTMRGQDQVYDLIVQHCRQSSSGHHACMTHFDSLWKQPVSHFT